MSYSERKWIPNAHRWTSPRTCSTKGVVGPNLEAQLGPRDAAVLDTIILFKSPRLRKLRVISNSPLARDIDRWDLRLQWNTEDAFHPRAQTHLLLTQTHTQVRTRRLQSPWRVPGIRTSMAKHRRMSVKAGPSQLGVGVSVVFDNYSTRLVLLSFPGMPPCLKVHLC